MTADSTTRDDEPVNEAETRDATRESPPQIHDPVNEIPDDVLAKVSDLLDGALTGAERAEVAQRVADDPTWQRAHRELTETRKYLSGLRKAHAPSSFAEDVAETIHQRSAGRFFGRRTLGDRVPFGAVLVVALAVLVVIGYVLWSSSTGSLKRDREPGEPPPAGSAVDRP